MRRRLVLSLGLCFSALAIPKPAMAQPSGQLDGGTFEHFLAGGFAGTETFAVRRRGQDLVAVGRVTREGGPEALRAVEVGMRVEESGRPLRYELHTREGPALHVVVNRTGSRLRVTTTADEGERFTEFLAGERLLIVEREIAHHYYSLARLLRRSAEPRSVQVEALIPSEGRTQEVRVRGLSRDTLTVENARLPATRYDMTVGSEQTTLWTATDDGRVLRVAIPSRQWHAVRVLRP